MVELDSVLNGVIQGGVAGVISIFIIKYILPKLDRIEELLVRIDTKTQKCVKNGKLEHEKITIQGRT